VGVGRGGGGLTWYKKYTYMNINVKMIPVESIVGMGGKGIKESGKGGEFKYDIFDTL
jgi:hypothetical protein